MFIEVNKIPPEGLRADRDLGRRALAIEGGEPAPLDGVRLEGWFRRAGGDVVFRGQVRAGVTLNCSRCLAPYHLDVQSPCTRLFRPGPLGSGPRDRELDEEELALTPFDGVRIDLAEMAQEQIYLMVPLKPLCREQCQGLCSRCGADRNLAPCGCPETAQSAEPLRLKIPL